MSNTKDNDPNDPDSKISRSMRFAYWVTGGSRRRSPSTATSFVNMAKERCEVAKAEVEWKRRKGEALSKHTEQWGSSGLAGGLEEMAASGPRPRGRELIQWWKENREGSGRNGVGEGERTTELGGEQQSQAGRHRSGADAVREPPVEGQAGPAEGQQSTADDNNGDAEPEEDGEDGAAGAASEVTGL